MEKQRFVGAEVHKLSKSLYRSIDAVAKKFGLEDLDYMQSLAINYLYCKRNEEIYQKDLEKVLLVGRSTVTCLVKQLESKNYIRREEVKADARLKKLSLTEDGVRKHFDMIAMFDEIEQQVKTGITPAELEVFFSVMSRMKANTAVMLRGTEDKKC